MNLRKLFLPYNPEIASNPTSLLRGCTGETLRAGGCSSQSAPPLCSFAAGTNPSRAADAHSGGQAVGWLRGDEAGAGCLYRQRRQDPVGILRAMMIDD